jgi:hypothetical protein
MTANKMRTAKALDASNKTLLTKIKEYGFVNVG